MPDDFDRRPRRSSPKRRHPAAFGVFIEGEEAQRPPRFTIMSILARLVAMLFAYLLLSFVLGGSAVTMLLSIVAGLVLYEVWYLVFESTA